MNEVLKQLRLISMMGVEEKPLLIKIALVGEGGVGKTSLLIREVRNTFEINYISTIGLDFLHKIYQVRNMSVKLQIWDMSGAQRFRSISSSYYRNSTALCICFSLCSRYSFDLVPKLFQDCQRFNPQAKLYLIGCKSDEKPQVPYHQALAFALTYQMVYLQTSSKNSEGVNEAFRKIAEEALQIKLLQISQEPKKVEKEKLAEKSFLERKGCY